MTGSRIGYKLTAEDEQIQGTFNITGEANYVQLNPDQLRLNDLYIIVSVLVDIRHQIYNKHGDHRHIWMYKP